MWVTHLWARITDSLISYAYLSRATLPCLQDRNVWTCKNADAVQKYREPPTASALEANLPFCANGGGAFTFFQCTPKRKKTFCAAGTAEITAVLSDETFRSSFSSDGVMKTRAAPVKPVTGRRCVLCE